MKNILFVSLLFLLAACGGNNDKAGKAETEATATAEKKYACPMQCEGEKTYAEAGKCPVCKMGLQEVAMAETDSTEHNH
ncbi:heavy metal-binding domain-containing protein [Dyadobacter alkalitolerans]|uniref:heavy metal-binding domain-containing protein n=1 Tax=Dyadobacter alkalitolerans TaxID=492736 RepID=UPI00047926EE|nr:heavy metal-binding domain-containing protein [Dyadobacter alkalitolerans]